MAARPWRPGDLLLHLGRPKGKRDPKYSLEPVRPVLASHLGTEVLFVDDVAGDQTRQAAEALGEGQVLLLKNLRYEPGEERNDRPGRPARLPGRGLRGRRLRGRPPGPRLGGRGGEAAARLRRLPAGQRGQGAVAAGGPERPFAAVLGGGKVSDKLAVLDNLLSRVDSLVVGGGMCFTFLAAQGHEIGDSLFEPDQVEAVRQLLETAGSQGKPVLLPTDVVVAREVSEDAETRTVPADGIEAGWKGLDIGPETAKAFAAAVLDAHRVLERPDGRVRAGPVRRRHQGGRRGGGRRRRLHGGRRGDSATPPWRARPGRPGRPPVHRQREPASSCSSKTLPGVAAIPTV